MPLAHAKLTATFTTTTKLFYELLQLLLLLTRPLRLETDRYKDRGGRNIQGQGGDPLPALQNPPTPDLQIDTRPRVQSTSDSEGDYKNALDRTIMSDSETETPPTRTPLSSPRLRRRPYPNPSPSSGSRPRTRNQTNKDGKTLGKLHDQPFPPERKRYERKINRSGRELRL
jgi:hypothetical protein